MLKSWKMYTKFKWIHLEFFNFWKHSESNKSKNLKQPNYNLFTKTDIIAAKSKIDQSSKSLYLKNSSTPISTCFILFYFFRIKENTDWCFCKGFIVCFNLLYLILLVNNLILLQYHLYSHQKLNVIWILSNFLIIISW